MIKKKLSVIVIFLFLISCNRTNLVENAKQLDNPFTCEFDFPSTVYTHKKYKGKIRFHNKMLDTIASPRRDTTNFRFIIYKPFTPYIESDKFNPTYRDSILLDNNSIDIEFEFDKPGVYNIGGFARDAMRMNYFSNGVRDSARFIEHEITIFHKVIVKDSI